MLYNSIHNHIIFCAVNFVDHHKYVSNKRTYYGIRNMSDRLLVQVLDFIEKEGYTVVALDRLIKDMTK